MIAKLPVLLALLFFTGSVHAQLAEQSRRESVQHYEVFELPEAEDWIGDSEIVKYEPPATSGGEWRTIELWMSESGGDAGIIYMRDWTPPPTPPIELEYFRRRVAADAKVTFGESDDDVRSARTNRSSASNNEFPLYANILNESGTKLADSLAYSQLEGTGDDTTVKVEGRVGTYADILAVLSSDDSSATATSSSSFTAGYKLNEEFDFILDTTLSTQLVEDGYSFRLRDVSADVDLISFQPEDGQSHRLELCGTLPPGTYELIVDTESDATTLTSGSPDFGGFGEFDFYFRAIDLRGVLDEVDAPLGAMTSSSGEPENFDLSRGNTVGNSAQSVPEPSGRELMILSVVLLWVRQRKRN